MTMFWLVHGRSRPEQIESLVQSTQQTFATRSLQESACLTACLYQGHLDPSRFMYLGQWESRAAAEAQALSQDTAALLEVWDTPPAQGYFRAVYSFERLPAPVQIMDTVLCAARPGTETLFLTALEQAGQPEVLAQPGLVLRYVCQNLDRPHEFLVMHGWESRAHLLAFVHDLEPRLTDVLKPYVSSFELFVGFPRASYDHASHRRRFS